MKNRTDENITIMSISIKHGGIGVGQVFIPPAVLLNGVKEGLGFMGSLLKGHQKVKLQKRLAQEDSYCLI